MAKIREKNELEKRWTWFLFAGANIFVVIGCAITWILFTKDTINVQSLFVPTLVCNLLAIALSCVFIYFEVKEIGPKAMHYQKKWLYFYLAAICLFIVAVLFSCLYFLCFLNKNILELRDKKMGWQFWIYFIITMVLTLVAIGFQRYARFRIDLDIYRRKHGQNPNGPDEGKDQKSEVNNAKNSNCEKSVEDTDKNKTLEKPVASSGLIDHM